jgi:hypothetical protein
VLRIDARGNRVCETAASSPPTPLPTAAQVDTIGSETESGLFSDGTAEPTQGSTTACMESGCDDGNQCTVDICNPVTGCSHTPVSCTDTSCIIGVCVDGICVTYDATGCSAAP